MVEVRCVEDTQGLQSLEPQWNALLGRSDSDSVFMTWEWVWTFWEVYGARYRPLVLVASEAGRVVGIAPLMVGRGSGRLTRSLRYLMFIGQNEDVTPEYLDFFIERGREEEVAEALCLALVGEQRGAWDLVRLERVLRSSPNLGTICAVLQHHGVPLERTAAVDCPYATLPGSWERYLASRSKHFRKRVGYNLRRLEREGPLALLHVESDVSLDKAYEELVRLNRERWGEAGESFQSERYVAFHRRVCERLLRRGWLLMVLLKVGERVGAAKYDYVYGGKVWGNQGGWLREYEKHEIGNVLLGMLIEHGIEQGCREYDFLGGEADYKRRWGDGARVMDDYAGWNTTARAQAFRAGQRGRDWLASRAAPWVRAHLPERWLDRVDRAGRLLGRNG
jgi:CelD/BcsL family acetyltransferase involved in cellulose biosynthesis